MAQLQTQWKGKPMLWLNEPGKFTLRQISAGFFKGVFVAWGSARYTAAHRTVLWFYTGRKPN